MLRLSALLLGPVSFSLRPNETLPECRHAYPDDVKFCRADGTLLVADSEGEAGTIKLRASRQVETAETRILPTEKAQAGNAQTIDEAPGKVEPTLDPLRSDPRFADLMRRVGLPQ